jgi:hypothetical protein
VAIAQVGREVTHPSIFDIVVIFAGAPNPVCFLVCATVGFGQTQAARHGGHARGLRPERLVAPCCSAAAAGASERAEHAFEFGNAKSEFAFSGPIVPRVPVAITYVIDVRMHHLTKLLPCIQTTTNVRKNSVLILKLRPCEKFN